ncbi:MAG: ABC transporter permease [Nanoarchaeota archaeon]|nr:ABC transporter permease [Nanoarchaeota archaeon]
MKDYITFAIQSITHRKVRSWLTILGIIIGIAAIVALVSTSQGLENAITSQFEELGTNRIYVMPAGGFTQVRGTGELTIDDVDVIEDIVGVDYVTSYLYDKKTITFNNEDVFAGVMGYETEVDAQTMFEGLGVNLESGRWFSNNEKGSIILGYKLARDPDNYFDKEIVVNNKVEIAGEKFEVIGIAEPLGNEEDDTNTYIAMEDARRIYDDEEGLTFIEVITVEGVDINGIAEDIERQLERSRGDEDFTVLKLEQVLEQFGVILDILQIVLGGIAAIALVVGGVGIMNSMYTNVLERKKEIGIFKAVGASPEDIRNMFVVEAGMIGLTGGIMGAILGILISFAIGEAAIAAGFLYLDIQIEYFVVIGGILFAFIVGMIAGYLPAREASKLYPVEALRE